MTMIVQDKNKHFYSCVAISAAVALTIALVGASWLPSVLAGFLSAAAAGCAKEYADHAWGGLFDWHDLLADLTGGAIGSLVGLLALAF